MADRPGHRNITVYFTEDELAAVDQEKERRGVSRSELIREYARGLRPAKNGK